MSAEAMFTNGGLRVKSGGQTVGFLWVEPAPNGGQIQRWVLTTLLTPGQVASFVFEAWSEAPKTLDSWNKAVRKVAEMAVWGQNPGVDGLWPAQKGAMYVVAQSRAASPLLVIENGDYKLTLPEPIYPRRDAVAAHAPAVRMGRPGGDKLAPAAATARQGHPGTGDFKITTRRDTPQTGVPFLEMQQWDPSSNLEFPILKPMMGIGGGHIGESSQRFFEGEELFLLNPDFLRAGTSETSMRWQGIAESEIKSLAALRTYILSSPLKEGQRCETTGCNYYKDIGEGKVAPPPDWFIAPEGL